MTESPLPLSSAERKTLEAVAEVLVPRAHGMPSAVDVALCRAEGPLDRALRHRPDLAEALRPLLEDARLVPPSEFIAGLQRDDSPKLHVLLQAVIGAYYLDGKVRERLGYFGQQPQTLSRAGIGAEGELERMMQRPPMFRRFPL